MGDLTSRVKEERLRAGADVAGFGDLSGLPPRFVLRMESPSFASINGR